MSHDPLLAPFLIICAQLQPIFQPWCQLSIRFNLLSSPSLWSSWAPSSCHPAHLCTYHPPNKLNSTPSGLRPSLWARGCHLIIWIFILSTLILSSWSSWSLTLILILQWFATLLVSTVVFAVLQGELALVHQATGLTIWYQTSFHHSSWSTALKGHFLPPPL